MQLQRRYSRAVPPDSSVLSDHTVALASCPSATAYPDAMRRVRFHDAETDKRLVFLTNNFDLPAQTIAQLYKERWRVELLFKWIKQHLRIKAFYGTSENSLKTQVRIAIATYLLVAILKKRLTLDASLYQILQVLSVTLFEKTPILQAYKRTTSQPEIPAPRNQLTLLDL